MPAPAETVWMKERAKTMDYKLGVGSFGVTSVCFAACLSTAACAKASRETPTSTADTGVVAEPQAEAGAKDDPVRPIDDLPLGEWTRLINQKWNLDAGSEGYWCRRVTVASDVLIHGFRAVAPKGTHHTTLGKDSGGPDGTFRCSGFSTGTNLIYGSGVGSAEMVFPDGIAVRVKAGEQLLLNVHVYDVSDEALSGDSAIEVIALSPDELTDEAALVLAGKASGLEVVPGESTQTGRCTLPSDTTAFSIGPHMHTRGVHQRVTMHSATGEATTVLDRDYDFTEQLSYPLETPMLLGKGAFIEVECSYSNPTAQTLTFGESTQNEMCYAGIYHYPVFQSGSTCVH